MLIVLPRYDILTPIRGDELYDIEMAGRTCYKSEAKITSDSAQAFVKKLIRSGHHAMIEHSILSVRFITDRATANAITRHRNCSFAQESSYFCNYHNAGNIEVIKPLRLSLNAEKIWEASTLAAESAYMEMIELGESRQNARAVLPLCTKTELIMTANYREWRHFLAIRTTPDNHYQMLELITPLLLDLQQCIPIIFDDLSNS